MKKSLAAEISLALAAESFQNSVPCLLKNVCPSAGEGCNFSASQECISAAKAESNMAACKITACKFAGEKTLLQLTEMDCGVCGACDSLKP